MLYYSYLHIVLLTHFSELIFCKGGAIKNIKLPSPCASSDLETHYKYMVKLEDLYKCSLFFKFSLKSSDVLTIFY